MSAHMVLGYRSTASTAEIVITTQRCMVFGLHPELTTTGTITLRDAAATGGANVKVLCAIGLTQAGKAFPQGVLFENGLTIQTSVATDLTLVQFLPM